MHPVVRPVGVDEHLAEVLHGGLAGVFDVLLEQHDPVRPSALRRVDGTEATTLGARADLRLLGHLDLGDQVAGRRVPPGEVDTSRLADQAASSVAPDEVLGSQRRVAGQRDVDAGVVLGEAHHLAAAEDRNSELLHPSGQDALEVALPEGEDVVVAGGEVTDVQEGPGVAHEGMDLPLREESFHDATLVEHLDGAGMKTPGSGAVELLAGASFDDDDVGPRQRQLGRQHQPGRATARDHHRMLRHRRSSAPCGAGRDRRSGRVMVSTFRSLAASPHPRGILFMAAKGSCGRADQDSDTLATVDPTVRPWSSLDTSNC